MCGICFFLHCESSISIHYLSTRIHFASDPNKTVNANVIEDVERVLSRRGPDSIRKIKIPSHQTSEKTNIPMFHLISSVLFIRGKQVVPQPLEDDEGNVLLWNGEIFGGIEVESGENDTKKLFQLLNQESSNVINIMRQVRGPWAFLYWQQKDSKLWFGRSYMGHRSLLLHFPSENAPFFSICSTAFNDLGPNIDDNEGEDEDEDESHWQEIKTGIYSLDFQKETNLEELKIVIDYFSFSGKKDEPSPFPKRTQIVPPPSYSLSIKREDYVRKFLDLLSDAVRVRVTTLPPPITEGAPRLGILFSGGIDSIMLAALADRHVPKNEPIDLFNVAFGKDSFQVPDRKTGIEGLGELNHISQRKWNFVKVDITPEEIHQVEEHIYSLIYPRSTIMDMTIGTALWFASRGVGNIYEGNSECVDPQLKEEKEEKNEERDILQKQLHQLIISSINILVKEGVLSHKILEEIDSSVYVKPTVDRQKKHGDLCSNVTFLIHQTKQTKLTPPEIGSLLAPYLSKHPKAQLNVTKNGFINFFISPREKTKKKKHNKKTASSQPSNTTKNTKRENSYTSPVKVLLLGNGADEQLAGYGRHRTCFMHRGWEGLQKELELDVHRLWKRNLGRDDRLISDNGKEARHPFLDENVITFINSIPLWEICDLGKPAGIGDKSILRQAASLIGLTNSTKLAKRAIQFGSRVGKLFFPSTPSDKIDGASKFTPITRKIEE